MRAALGRFENDVDVKHDCDQTLQARSRQIGLGYMLGQRTAQSSRCVALGNGKVVLSEIRRKESVPVRIGSYRDVVAGCDEAFTYK